MSNSNQNSPPSSPSLPWRFGSSVIMGLTGGICRTFYYGLNKMEVVGLDKFLETLNKRENIQGRERGLLTGTSPLRKTCWMYANVYDRNSFESRRRVCYVFCALNLAYSCAASVDDPLVWGVLPYRYHFNSANHRWSLGSYDICFTNKYAALHSAAPIDG